MTYFATCIPSLRYACDWTATGGPEVDRAAAKHVAETGHATSVRGWAA